MLVNQSLQDKVEQLLFANAFQFSGCKVKDIMIHRKKMFCIDVNTIQEQVLNIITINGYTIYPVVYQERIILLGLFMLEIFTEM